MEGIKDVAIIGMGPAGISAAIYCARYALDVVMFGMEIGGTASEAHIVDNYPGFPNSNGKELTEKMMQHVKKFQVGLRYEEVGSIEKEGDDFTIKSSSGITKAKTVIFSTGLKRRKLNVPGEEQFLGRGVSYCATCDGMFYKDKKVIVVGGSDAAAQAALLLAQYADDIKILYRKEELRCEPMLKQSIDENEKITIVPNVNVTEIKGEKLVEKVILDNGEVIQTDGVFIEVGAVPSLSLINQAGVKIDEKGFIIIDDLSRTNIDGFYAAGDITNKPLKQIITAAAQGANAAYAAYQHIQKRKINIH